MMESEILKFICANQGAVNTDYLVFNLGAGDSTNVTDIIRNHDKFASCCPFGQPKVVARTNLRLCRAKDCPGTCRGLHLCKNILFSGSCQFSLRRRGCTFSHDLDSDHNERILKEHELDRLSRTELCTLLLQSDERLLPSICHDYNNGDGEFGRCQDGMSCTRLHICERFLNRDCNCTKTHDFTAPQPLKTLQDKGVPAELLCSLKSVYANILALRYNRGNSQHRGGYQPNRGNRGNRGYRGYRGNRGNSGYRGNRGNSHQQQRSSSMSDIFDDFSVGDNSDGTAANDSDASSDNGQNRKQTENPNKTPTADRGRGGNRGNRGNWGNKQVPRTSSTNDITTAGDEANSDGGASRRERQRHVRDKTEICMYFIKGHCKHEERCFKAHDKMPYRWEVQQDDQWTAMPENETIEKDYCDPKNTYSNTCPPVHFDTMTCGSNKVRRLSTTNSALEPDFVLTTEWLWYWEDEFGKWNIYASSDHGHRAATIDSLILEQKFLHNEKDVVEFTAGSQSYSLSFQDMIQTNKQYSTKRVVKRRPRFVSVADVQTRRFRRPHGPSNFAAIPDHWDKTQIPQKGYGRVSLKPSSDEFKQVEALFCKTMRGFDIVKIERVQNKALWEVFQWQKTQMKNNNNGCFVTERKLFHGTDSKYLDVICHTNFDWRICGTHGTAFGKGSYFARDAKYSHSYTDDSNDVKSMFIARVLVGHYTKGSSDYRRPPSKDGGDINFYDSCVDDVINPTIYVVFEKHQIYPEYLLQYKTQSPVDLFASVRAVKPPSQSLFQPSTVSPQPKTSYYQPSAASSQPTTSSYQPRTSSYQPSTSSYQPSTSSYQPSASSYQPSAASSQPKTPSYQPSTSSYRFQPMASSSPPTPKKSDSCVIA